MTAVMRWTIDPEASGVMIDGASSVHPIRASATGLRGWIELSVSARGVVAGSAVTGHIEIDVAGLESGNALIDRETRRRILAHRYPEITGDIVTGTVTEDAALALDGVIVFRGEHVRVEGSMTVVEIDSDRMTLEGAARFDVRWWGLRPPRLGLLRVYPEIDVAVHVEAVSTG